MKQIIILIGLITSMYAVNEKCQAPICTYIYKGAMSGELILVNNTKKKANVNLHASLDSQGQNFENIIIQPQSQITLLRSRYDDHLKKPNGGSIIFRYEFIEEKKIKETQSTTTPEERKSNIKINMN